MPTTQMHTVLKHLRRVLTPDDAGGSSDWELLQRFAGARDEAAFEVLLWRHHRMVLSVCGRILADSHDVEDAFQATFLVLARKAKTIQRSGSVASWLYGVARRVALEVSRRSAPLPSALRVTPSSGPDPSEEVLRLELRRVFDKELGRLPEKYRAPVVLCYLEGRTYEQAGQQLGCSKGTVSTRLARARALLKVRLTNRGLALSAGALAVWLCEQSAMAGMPGPLVASTCKVAALIAAGKAASATLSPKVAALCEGVIHAMFISKLKVTVGILCLVVVLGAGLGTWTSAWNSQAAAGQTGQGKSLLPPDRNPQDRDAIQGTWKVVSCQLDGEKVPTDDFAMVIGKDKILVKDEGLTKEFTYTLDPGKKPRHINWVANFGVNKGKAVKGIYRLDGRTLVLCTNGPQAVNRPKEFKAGPYSHVALMVLEREKPPDKNRKPDSPIDFQAFSERGRSIMNPQVDAHFKGKWEVDLNEVHRNPAFKNTCVLCHQQNKIVKAPDLDKLILKQFGDLAIIRLPKKKGPAEDAEFLRRLCLDILGRTPTPLEMHYFLKDSSPDKHRQVAERLLNQDSSPFVVVKVKSPDRTARAEEFVKKQLGKDKLSPAERRLIEKVLEFMDQEQTQNSERRDLMRLWMEHFGAPSAEPRKKEK